MKNDSKIPNSKRILNPLIDSEDLSPSLKKIKIHHEKNDIVENTSSFAMKSKSNNENKNTALPLSLPQSSLSQSEVSILNQNAHSAYPSDKDMGIGSPMALNADLESIKNKLNIEGITNDISRYMRSMSREDYLNNNNLKMIKKLNNLLLMRKTIQHLIGVMIDNIQSFNIGSIEKHELDYCVEKEKKYFYKGIKDKIQQVYTSLEDPDEILSDILKPLPEWMQSEFQEFSSEIKKSYLSGPSGVDDSAWSSDDMMVSIKSDSVDDRMLKTPLNSDTDRKVDTAINPETNQKVEEVVNPETNKKVDISNDVVISSSLGVQYPNLCEEYHNIKESRINYQNFKPYLFGEHSNSTRRQLFIVMDHAYGWVDKVLRPSKYDLNSMDTNKIFLNKDSIEEFKICMKNTIKEAYLLYEDPDFFFNTILDYIPFELKTAFQEVLHDVSIECGGQPYPIEIRGQLGSLIDSTALMVDTATAQGHPSAYEEYRSLNESRTNYLRLRPCLFDHYPTFVREEALMVMDKVYNLVGFFLDTMSQGSLSKDAGTKLLTKSQIKVFKSVLKKTIKEVSESYEEPDIFFEDILMNIPFELKNVFQEVLYNTLRYGSQQLDGISFKNEPTPVTQTTTPSTAISAPENLYISGANLTAATVPTSDVKNENFHVESALNTVFSFSGNLHGFKTVVDNCANNIKIEQNNNTALEFLKELNIVIDENISRVEQNLKKYFSDDSTSDNSFLYTIDSDVDNFLVNISFVLEEFLRRDSKKDFIEKFIQDVPEAFKRELENSLNQEFK